MNLVPRAALVTAGWVLALGGCGAAPSGTAGATSPASGATASSIATTTSPTATRPTPSDPAPTAEALLGKARARAKTLRSLAYEARIPQKGEDPIEISFRGSRTEYEVVVTVGPAKGTFLVHGDYCYVRGNATFWKAQKVPNPGKSVYIRIPTKDYAPVERLGMDSTLRRVFTVFKNRSTPVAEESQLSGREAWTIHDPRGANGGTLYFARDTFDLLRIAASDGDGVGSYDFHDWNRTFSISTPPRSQVIVPRSDGGGAAT